MRVCVVLSITLIGITAWGVPRTVTFRDGQSPEPSYAGTRDVTVVGQKVALQHSTILCYAVSIVKHFNASE